MEVVSSDLSVKSIKAKIPSTNFGSRLLSPAEMAAEPEYNNKNAIANRHER